jgi:hypothetical protein
MYYVSFIDYFSLETWIYFLNTKDFVFKKFKEFKSQIENLIQKKIKILTWNNGGKYTSKDFDGFCEVGINRDMVVLYKP